jgi:hypothetical protein
MPLLSLPLDVLRLIGDKINQERTAQSQLDILRLQLTCQYLREVVQLQHIVLSFEFPLDEDPRAFIKLHDGEVPNHIQQKIKSFIAFTRSHRNYKELHLTASGSPSIGDRALTNLFSRMFAFRPLELKAITVFTSGNAVATYGAIRMLQLQRVNVYMPLEYGISFILSLVWELQDVGTLNVYSRYLPHLFFLVRRPLLGTTHHHHLGANLDFWATKLYSSDLLSKLRSINVTSLHPVEEAFRQDYKQQLAIFSRALVRPLPLLESFRLDEKGDWPDEPLDAFVAPNVQKLALPWWAIDALVLKVAASKYEGLEESRIQEVVLSMPPPGHAWLGEGKVDGLGAVFREMGATLYLCDGDCQFLPL